jgi:hypothetical protein
MRVLCRVIVDAQEQLVSALQDAVAAVEAAGVPEDLRPAAFSKVFEHIAGGGPSASQGRGARGGAEAGDIERGDAVGRIATRLGLEAEVVSRVFDVDDEGVHLTVPRSALDDSKRTAMREVARLISAARQAAGVDDEYTPLATIREACDDRGVLNSPNFAAAMQALDGDGMRFRGASGSREVKVNTAGYEKAADIVRRIAGR